MWHWTDDDSFEVHLEDDNMLKDLLTDDEINEILEEKDFSYLNTNNEEEEFND